MTKQISITVILAAALLTSISSATQAQEQQSQSAGRVGGNLAQQARDPTAALTMMSIVGSYNPRGVTIPAFTIWIARIRPA